MIIFSHVNYCYTIEWLHFYKLLYTFIYAMREIDFRYKEQISFMAIKVLAKNRTPTGW